MFACLADPSRRRILALLRDAGELRVGDIAAAFEISLNGVSKHLKVLESARLVRRRKAGVTHWISADWDGLLPANDYLDDHRRFWGDRLDALHDHLIGGTDE